MSASNRGARASEPGHPYEDEQVGVPGPRLRVFWDGDPPPPPDVQALIDHKGGYWPRMGEDCWNCPGNEPHTWHEMACAGPFVEAPRLPGMPEVAATIAADKHRRQRGDRL